MLIRGVLLLGLLFTQHALGAVEAAGATGFSLRIVTTSKANTELAYTAFTDIGKWWNAAHSYTGDAANLSLQLQPGGAFLERMSDGGFVQHMTVVYHSPNKEIRLMGGLGPLQPMGIHGVMTVKFTRLPAGSEISMVYNVSGFSGQSLEGFAAVVDRVQQEQMDRHAAYADTLVAAP